MCFQQWKKTKTQVHLQEYVVHFVQYKYQATLYTQFQRELTQSLVKSIILEMLYIDT